MDETRLCLIRHGETAWNAERRIQGQLDPPLNSIGIAQARAAANALRDEAFAAIYSSDLARARHTAELIGHVLHLPIELKPELRERHYGRFQTLTYDEARSRFPEDYARFEARDIDFALPEGESLSAFARRVVDCVESIVARHAGRQILLVAHGGVLDILYRHATGKPLASARDFEIPNAALNWIRLRARQWSVSAWANRSHIARSRDEEMP